MNKTNIQNAQSNRIGNLRQEECDSILEFLFKEQAPEEKNLEDYVGKYLESQEKWRLVFDCMQEISISSDINSYLFELIDGVKNILPSLKIAVVIYDKKAGKNKIFTRENDAKIAYISDSIFPLLNMYDAHLEIVKYYTNANYNPNYKILPLEADEIELGYIYFETAEDYDDSDIGYFEKLCCHIISAIETVELYNGVKNENNERIDSITSFSHEIKTPLNSIIAYIELLGKNSVHLSSELKNYVENIKISSHQLKGLLADIIESTKIQCGKITIRKQSFEIRRAIEDVLKIFNFSINEKKININPALMQANIVSDYTKFNQILYNLISNAIKFSDVGGTIDITSWVEENKYCFEIKNEGDYIDKNEVEKIFKFLHKTNTDPLKNPEGSGIGLSVTKQLIEALDGTLEFKSSEQETVFSFCLAL